MMIHGLVEIKGEIKREKKKLSAFNSTYCCIHQHMFFNPMYSSLHSLHIKAAHIGALWPLSSYASHVPGQGRTHVYLT